MSITVFIYIDHPNGVPSEQTTNTFSEARGEPKSFNARCISHGTNRDNPHLYRYKDSARRAEKQIYLHFPEPQPIFTRQRKVVQSERKNNFFLYFTEPQPLFTRQRKDSARRAEKQIYLDKFGCTSAIEKTGLSLHSVCSNFAF
jgi:hypothetical protein